jgi:hypothetical protein
MDGKMFHEKYDCHIIHLTLTVKAGIMTITLP